MSVLYSKLALVECIDHQMAIGFFKVETQELYCQQCILPSGTVQIMALGRMLEEYSTTFRHLIQLNLNEIARSCKSQSQNIENVLQDMKAKTDQTLLVMDELHNGFLQFQGSQRSNNLAQILVDVFQRVTNSLNVASSQANIMELLKIIFQNYCVWCEKKLNDCIKQLKNIDKKIKYHQDELLQIQESIEKREFSRATIKEFIVAIRPYLMKSQENIWCLSPKNDNTRFYSRKLALINSMDIQKLELNATMLQPLLYRMRIYCLGKARIKNAPGYSKDVQLQKKFNLLTQPSKIILSRDAQFAAIYHQPKWMTLMNLQKGSITPLEFGDVLSFNFTSDCKQIIFQAENSLKYFDLKKMKVTEELKGVNENSNMMEISENNEYVALIDLKNIHLYKKRSLIYSECFHDCYISGAAISSTNNTLVLGYKNTQVIVISLKTLSKVHKFQLNTQSSLKAVRFSQNFKFIAISGNSSLFLFQFDQFEKTKDAISSMAIPDFGHSLSFSTKDDLVLLCGGRSLVLCEPFQQKRIIIAHEYQISREPGFAKNYIVHPSKPNTLIGVESLKSEVSLFELSWTANK